MNELLGPITATACSLRLSDDVVNVANLSNKLKCRRNLLRCSATPSGGCRIPRDSGADVKPAAYLELTAAARVDWK